MLRIDDPFVLNRRVATRAVEIAGRTVPQGARVSLNWAAANRDPAVFVPPEDYQPSRNAEHNLVYGIGPHACPGRALATHELREALTALLRATTAITVSPNEPASRATLPLGGYERVPVILLA
jgi:cytochrome P450